MYFTVQCNQISSGCDVHAEVSIYLFVGEVRACLFLRSSKRSPAGSNKRVARRMVPGAGTGWEAAAAAGIRRCFPRQAAERRPRRRWRDPQAPRRGVARLVGGSAGPPPAPPLRRGGGSALPRAPPLSARGAATALPHGCPGGGGARSRAAPGRGAPRLLLAALLHRRRWVPWVGGFGVDVPGEIAAGSRHLGKRGARLSFSS